jgi:Icc-related predicted phosphoesterase
VGELTKTRVFFVTDIHGSERLLLKFLNAAKVYKANVLIYGGDITGKTITPIMDENGSWKAEYVGSQRTASTEIELDNLEREIRALGSYPFRTTRDEWDTLRQSEEKMEQVFAQLMIDSLRHWTRIATERLKPMGVKVIFNAGNDDLPVVREVLAESDFVIYPEEKIVFIDDRHEMPSVGYSNMTPWNCPGDLSEEELASRLEKATSGLADPANSLFNFHCPPYDTQIDVAPKLDKELRPVLTPGGEPEMAHVGSTAVRQMIEKLQPLAGVHGHIHESRGFSKIGKTVCFNPGSEYTTGVLRGLIINLSDKKLDNYLFTEG